MAFTLTNKWKMTTIWMKRARRTNMVTRVNSRRILITKNTEMRTIICRCPSIQIIYHDKYNKLMKLTWKLPSF